jgi:hypothetical protein
MCCYRLRRWLLAASNLAVQRVKGFRLSRLVPRMELATATERPKAELASGLAMAVASVQAAAT